MYTPGVGIHPRMCFTVADFRDDIISLLHYLIFFLVFCSKSMFSFSLSGDWSVYLCSFNMFRLLSGSKLLEKKKIVCIFTQTVDLTVAFSEIGSDFHKFSMH